MNDPGRLLRLAVLLAGLGALVLIGSTIVDQLAAEVRRT